MINHFLMFPIIFIFHDMEEIVGMRWFVQKNGEKLKRNFPKMMRLYDNFSTDAFAAAVYEELIVCMAISIAAGITENRTLVLLWIGAFAGCTVHFAVHIMQSIAIRCYIPALVTSCICLPVSVRIILWHIKAVQSFDTMDVLTIAMGCMLVFINLAVAHKVMNRFESVLK